MFLNTLTEVEKKAFLELAHLIANSNGIINEEERQMIESYDLEMGIDVKVEDLEDLSLSSIISTFESENSKRVTFIESIAIAFVDGVYDDEQKQMINEIREAYGFSVEYYEEVKAWIKEFYSVYSKGLELLNGPKVSL